MIDGRSGVAALTIGALYRVVIIDPLFGVHDEGQARIHAAYPAIRSGEIDTVFTSRGSFGVANPQLGWRRQFFLVPNYVMSMGRGI